MVLECSTFLQRCKVLFPAHGPVFRSPVQELHNWGLCLLWSSLLSSIDARQVHYCSHVWDDMNSLVRPPPQPHLKLGFIHCLSCARVCFPFIKVRLKVKFEIKIWRSDVKESWGGGGCDCVPCDPVYTIEYKLLPGDFILLSARWFLDLTSLFLAVDHGRLLTATGCVVWRPWLFLIVVKSPPHLLSLYPPLLLKAGSLPHKGGSILFRGNSPVKCQSAWSCLVVIINLATTWSSMWWPVAGG